MFYRFDLRVGDQEFETPVNNRVKDVTMNQFTHFALFPINKMRLPDSKLDREISSDYMPFRQHNQRDFSLVWKADKQSMCIKGCCISESMIDTFNSKTLPTSRQITKRTGCEWNYTNNPKRTIFFEFSLLNYWYKIEKEFVTIYDNKEALIVTREISQNLAKNLTDDYLETWRYDVKYHIEVGGTGEYEAKEVQTSSVMLDDIIVNLTNVFHIDAREEQDNFALYSKYYGTVHQQNYLTATNYATNFKMYVNHNMSGLLDKTAIFGKDHYGHDYIADAEMDRCNSQVFRDPKVQKLFHESEILLKMPIIMAWKKFRTLCEYENNIEKYFKDGKQIYEFHDFYDIVHFSVKDVQQLFSSPFWESYDIDINTKTLTRGVEELQTEASEESEAKMPFSTFLNKNIKQVSVKSKYDPFHHLAGGYKEANPSYSYKNRAFDDYFDYITYKYKFCEYLLDRVGHTTVNTDDEAKWIEFGSDQKTQFKDVREDYQPNSKTLDNFKIFEDSAMDKDLSKAKDYLLKYNDAEWKQDMAKLKSFLLSKNYIGKYDVSFAQELLNMYLYTVENTYKTHFTWKGSEYSTKTSYIQWFETWKKFITEGILALTVDYNNCFLDNNVGVREPIEQVKLNGNYEDYYEKSDQDGFDVYKIDLDQMLRYTYPKGDDKNYMDPKDMPTSTDFLCLKWLGERLSMTMTKSMCDETEMVGYYEYFNFLLSRATINGNYEITGSDYLNTPLRCFCFNFAKRLKVLRGVQSLNWMVDIIFESKNLFCKLYIFELMSEQMILYNGPLTEISEFEMKFSAQRYLQNSCDRLDVLDVFGSMLLKFSYPTEVSYNMTSIYKHTKQEFLEWFDRDGKFLWVDSTHRADDIAQVKLLSLADPYNYNIDYSGYKPEHVKFLYHKMLQRYNLDSPRSESSSVQLASEFDVDQYTKGETAVTKYLHAQYASESREDYDVLNYGFESMVFSTFSIYRYYFQYYRAFLDSKANSAEHLDNLLGTNFNYNYVPPEMHQDYIGINYREDKYYFVKYVHINLKYSSKLKELVKNRPNSITSLGPCRDKAGMLVPCDLNPYRNELKEKYDPVDGKTNLMYYSYNSFNKTMDFLYTTPDFKILVYRSPLNHVYDSLCISERFISAVRYKHFLNLGCNNPMPKDSLYRLRKTSKKLKCICAEQVRFDCKTDITIKNVHLCVFKRLIGHMTCGTYFSNLIYNELFNNMETRENKYGIGAEFALRIVLNSFRQNCSFNENFE